MSVYGNAYYPKPFSQQAGVAFWKELVAAGRAGSGIVHFDPMTRGAWVYDGTNPWTGDTPHAITARGAYATAEGLGGVFAFSLEGEDSSGSLVRGDHDQHGLAAPVGAGGKA